MLEAVLVFAALTALFEYMVLYKMSPRTRLRWLGHPGWLTLGMAAINLTIHWGTITGSMTAVTAALASHIALIPMRLYWGYIEYGNYVAGIKKFPLAELR